MAFIDLEKAFDRKPRKVIWWALRKLGVDEWIVQLVQGMYSNARSHVHVGEGYSEESEVRVGVHQGSVLSQLLFIIVLGDLSLEFRCGVPWEDLYADDLVIIAESMEERVRRLLTWKGAMEKKRLRVRKDKDTDWTSCRVQVEFPCAVCHTGVGSNSIYCKDCKEERGRLLTWKGAMEKKRLRVRKDKDTDWTSCRVQFPCAVCHTGVGSNSIYCKDCKHRVHKKCSGLKHLSEDPDYRCTPCARELHAP